MAGEDENFLSRWSRLKREDKEKPAPAASPDAAPTSEVDRTDAQQPAPAMELPPVETLTLESDYRAFLQPGVSGDLRKAALKKLFSDPHFHFAQMDKLDTYIDDYTIEDPISEEMVKSLDHARHIIFDKEQLAEDAAGPAGAANAGEIAADAPGPAGAQPQGKNDDPRQDS